MIRHIPNMFTLANLLCGCIGIVRVFGNDAEGASFLILLAALFDFFDGFAARLLKAASLIGKDLDSLADMVTFGVLPSFILFDMMSKGFQGGNEWLAYSAFLVALFSALRLARFNNDPRQTDRFIGLPTPANAMLIASFPHILAGNSWGETIIGNPWNLLVFSVVISYLLVAEIPLLALKFKGFGWTGNRLRYLLIAASVLLPLLLGWAAVPLIMMIYLGLSVAERSLMRQ